MDEMMTKDKYQTRENYLQYIDYFHSLYFHKPDGQIHSAMLAIQREYELKFPISFVIFLFSENLKK